jgi:rhamnosyltransferase
MVQVHIKLPRGVVRIPESTYVAVSVVTIVVTFNTNVEALRINLTGLVPASKVLICDNSTNLQIRDQLAILASSEYFYYLPMHGNKGIAYAQNRGIEFAKDLGANCILFVDDDSGPLPGMLEKLVESYQTLLRSKAKVGVVGALAINSKGQSFSGISKGHGEIISRPSMMSSGSLIPMSAIEQVGMMDESLFIDFVDFDWSWRARSNGYSLYLVNNAYFRHSLGVGIANILGFKLKVPIPVRHYYQFRNALRMLLRPYVPVAWKSMQVPAFAARFILFSLLVSPRRKRVFYMLRGLRDGIIGRVGALDG